MVVHYLSLIRWGLQPAEVLFLPPQALLFKLKIKSPSSGREMFVVTHHTAPFSLVETVTMVGDQGGD